MNLPSLPIVWTEEQEVFFQAVLGPDNVVGDARAGSAKTTSLVEAIVRLIRAKPGVKILLCAFNVKIKDEIIFKLAKALSGQEMSAKAANDFLWRQGITVKTLNGVGHGAWNKYIKSTLDMNKNYDIVSSLLKAEDLMELYSDVAGLVSKAKISGLVPEKVRAPNAKLPDTEEEWEKLAVHYDYECTPVHIQLARQALLKHIMQAQQGNIDFDDQLYMPIIFNVAFEKYDYVFVDEAQDLSAIQHEMVAKSVKMSGKIIAVGDPHQAIYGFRGAMVDSMEQMYSRFKAVPAKLTVCFRCSKAVVTHVQKIVGDIQYPESAVDGKIELTRTPWGPWTFESGDAIICRNNAPLIGTAFRLIRNGVSCYMIGRDIGKGLTTLINKLCPNPHTPLPEFHQKLHQWLSNERQTADAKRAPARRQKAEDKVECLDAVLEHSGASDLPALHDAIRQLFSRETGKVTLSTGHKAKGLEFKRVFHLDSELIYKFAEPDTWEYVQARNLHYVIDTRAQVYLRYIQSDDYKNKLEEAA